jgi:hypothetical protein
MQHLEVSSAVRHIFMTLGGKGLCVHVKQNWAERSFTQEPKTCKPEETPKAHEGLTATVKQVDCV